MVNVLEQAGGCSIVRRSEGKNRFFGNLWSTFTHTGLKSPWGNWTIFGQHFGQPLDNSLADSLREPERGYTPRDGFGQPIIDAWRRHYVTVLAPPFK
jgi:hypothetical protein